MKHLILRTIAGTFLAAMTATGMSRATTLSPLDLTPGDGLAQLTRDSATNLAWLDLTETINLSKVAIEGGAGGWLTAGFRYATRAEVRTLTENHGFPTPSPIILNAAAAPFYPSFAALLGETCPTPGCPLPGVVGFSADPTPTPGNFHMPLVQSSLDGALARVSVSSSAGSELITASHIGSWLVRPEGCGPQPSADGAIVGCRSLDPDGLFTDFSNLTIDVLTDATVRGEGFTVGATSGGFSESDNSTISNFGEIIPDAQSGGTPRWAIGMVGDNNSVLNAGAITHALRNTDLIQMLGSDLVVENSGVLSSSGSGAVGISITGHDGSSLGTGRNHRIINSGRIDMSGTNGGSLQNGWAPAMAIAVERSDNTIIINEEGGVLTTIGPPAVSMNGQVRFRLQVGPELTGFKTTLINRGSILSRGDSSQGVSMPSLGSNIAAIGARGDETIDNSGEIEGRVLFGGGQDTYIIRDQGRSDGRVDGEGGFDTLIADISTGFNDIGGPQNDGPFFNFESFQKIGAGELRLHDGLTVDAARVDDGLLTQISGQIVTTDGVTVGNGGVLGGAIDIAGGLIVENGGAVAPGSSPGVAFVLGDLTVKSGGTLVVEIGGPAIGEFDRILVGGDAFLDGILELVFIDEFLPEPDQIFPFMQVSGSIFGAFEGITVRGMNLANFDLNFIDNEASLTGFIVASSVPEPGALAIFVFGLAGLSVTRRRWVAWRTCRKGL